jgi:acetoin utilization deacetylase AcuC-like enzyme
MERLVSQCASTLKVVYHEKYREIYSGDPASEPGRIECIYNELHSSFEFVKPEFANEEHLEFVHTRDHINHIKKLNLYQNALLAAGGAIRAAEIAFEGEPAFGLIRPPGHHASPESCWGFCFFNNIAISIEKLRRRRMIERALIIDIDLHYGDGTANIFHAIPEVKYFHLPEGDGEQQIQALSDYLDGEKGYDIIGVSAGFDRHVKDWGGTLTTEDYEEIGMIIKEFTEKTCDGRRYGVLEGGYNHQVLGKNVRFLFEGLR